MHAGFILIHKEKKLFQESKKEFDTCNEKKNNNEFHFEIEVV